MVGRQLIDVERQDYYRAASVGLLHGCDAQTAKLSLNDIRLNFMNFSKLRYIITQKDVTVLTLN